MSQVMQYRFRLFGPYAGKTMTVNGHQFVNGETVLVQSSENMGACTRVLSFYGAFHAGTPEYEEALAKELAEQEAAKAAEETNGGSEVHSETESGSSDEVRGDIQSDGTKPSEAPADVSPVDAEAETGNSGIDTSGDGHGHAGVPKFEEAADQREPSEHAPEINEAVKTAVLKLDPAESSQWVSTGAHAGKPKLLAVEEAYGRAGLTRQDVEAAIPGWNRDLALETALEA